MLSIKSPPRGRAYGALLALRLASVLFPGYLHPDEFFQGPQPAAAAMLGAQVSLPWEFTSAGALRSVLTLPFAACGAPYAWLRLVDGWLTAPEWVSVWLWPRAMLWGPKMTMVLMSFLVDIFLSESELLEESRHWALWLWASSWACLSLQTRTLSNGVETMLLCAWVFLCLRKPCPPEGEDRKPSGFLHHGTALGCVLALGLWTRMSFVAFAALPGLLYMWEVLRQQHRPLGQRLRECMWDATWALISFALTSSMLILADTIYYDSMHVIWQGRALPLYHIWRPIVAGSHRWFVNAMDFTYDASGWIQWLEVPHRWSPLAWTSGAMSKIRLKGHWTVTPINFYRYNSDPSNLALHGLHPWWISLVAHLPMLVGPLLLPLVMTIITSLQRRHVGFSALQERMFRTLCATVVLSLCFFSMLPHQEARFLLPIVPITIYLSAPLLSQLSAWRAKVFWMLWLCFNGALVVFWSGLHQAAVTRSAMDLPRQFPGMLPQQIGYWKTLSPPDYLACSLSSRVTDLMGAPVQHVVAWAHDATVSSPGASMALVLPRTLCASLHQALLPSNLTSSYLTSWWPHLTTESPMFPPRSMDDLSLALVHIYPTACATTTIRRRMSM